MNEQEWLECTDPETMLKFMEANVSERKLQVFYCASARRVWHLMDTKWQQSIERVELFFDGRITLIDMMKASGLEEKDYKSVTVADTVEAICDFWHIATMNVGHSLNERRGQANILRDIFGNPFRTATINPAWLTWNDGTVRKIAQAIYDEKAFDRMPILADALTDADCDNADLLNHCRREGPHVKGCWVVDLLIGRQ